MVYLPFSMQKKSDIIMSEVYAKINELAEKYRDYTAENLSKLVKIKSLSLQEKEVQQELKRQMEEAGFDEVRIDGLGNVIGRVGNGKKYLPLMATWIQSTLDNLKTGILIRLAEKLKMASYT